MIWPSRCAGPLPARASWCNWLPNWVSSAPLLLSMRKCLFASNLTKAANINSINAALTNQLPSNQMEVLAKVTGKLRLIDNLASVRGSKPIVEVVNLFFR